MQARRLGWQGTVTLGFRITPDRRIEAIKVQRSSGYRLLDEAAVEALGQVRQLPSSDGLQLASAHDLTLPVLYHIKER
jgi:protein TonB